MIEGDNAMNAPQWFSELCSQAERLRHELEDATPEDALNRIMDIVAHNHLVVGIWREPMTSRGFNGTVIKGASILQSVTDQKTELARAAAIPCLNIEQAIVASRLIGDMRDEELKRFH